MDAVARLDPAAHFTEVSKRRTLRTIQKRTQTSGIRARYRRTVWLLGSILFATSTATAAGLVVSPRFRAVVSQVTGLPLTPRRPITSKRQAKGPSERSAKRLPEPSLEQSLTEQSTPTARPHRNRPSWRPTR